MRVLVYKRTHEGDPDPDTGCFGCYDCMGAVRGWNYDAVIGIGGVGEEPTALGLAGKVTWIGIRPHKRKVPKKRGPHVWFEHFRYFETDQPDFRTLAPKLARRMFAKNIRVVLKKLNDTERAEIASILELARRAKPSSGLPLATLSRKAVAQPKSKRPPTGC